MIADIARYTDLKLAVAEPAASLQFSGAVFKDRIGEWIVALPEVAPVAVERDGASFTIVSRSAQAPVRH